MSMQDLAKLVPDQSDSLSELAGQNCWRRIISLRCGALALVLLGVSVVNGDSQSTGGLDGRPP